MKFEIRSVENGYILKCEGDEFVVQECENEVEAFADFLRTITDAYGPQDGRHEAQRIHILVRPGDKHPNFNGCPECGEHRG